MGLILKLLKFVFILLFIVILAGGGYYIYTKIPKTVCDRTLRYDIGTFDPQFGITRDQFITTLQNSENVWEGPFGKNFFEYTPGTVFKVNLVFDERQKQSNERKQLDAQIITGKDTFSSVKAQYDKLVASYGLELDQYNQEVSKWNSQGGAPQDDYVRLQNQKKQLDSKYQQIKALESQLNNLSGSINNKVDQYNVNAGETFHKGEYDGKAINVYEFQDPGELKLALAHEFGHALNLQHGDNPKAIMYPLLKDQDLNNIALAQADKDALITECHLKK